MAVNEKIRPLTNRVKIAGALVSLSEMKEGVTQNGVPYVSFSGKVACDETGAIEINFRTFERSKLKSGADNKNYPEVIKWYRSARPKETNPDNPTMVTIGGSLTDNPFVNREGKLVEGCQYTLKFFSEFKTYLAQIDIEGYIYSLVDEVKGEDEVPTGRKRMRLISMDGYGNVLSLNSVVIPADFVDALDDAGWEKGATISVAIDVLPSEMPQERKTVAFGHQHVVNDRIYKELVVTGGNNAYDPDSEQAITFQQAQAMLGERKNKLEEVFKAGYLGKNTSDTMSRGSIGSKKIKPADDFVLEEEDYPF